MFLLWIVMALFSGCVSKVYFTDEIRHKIEKKGLSLKNIQYYTDVDVTLKRELPSEQINVESGKVKEENGKLINFVYLSQYTPGVCDTIYNDKIMGIKFEQGQNKTLLFGKWPEEGEGKDTLYKIFALDWKNDTGKVIYDSTVFYIQPEGSQAKLMINKKVLNKIDVNKRRMKGVKLD